MKPDLMALSITAAQLETITGLDIGRVFMGGVIRPSVCRSSRRLLSLVVTEGAALAVLFIMGLGIGLVIIRNGPGAGNPWLLILIVTLLTVVCAIAWHLYQWSRYKTLKPLANLLDEVDRHNDIVQAVQVMDELEAVQGDTFSLPNRAAVLTALQTTRESLLLALRTDKILRQHRSLIQRRQELFSTIQTHLATLQDLHVQNQASDYQQFLQEALDIGLAVQAEMERQNR